MIGVTIGGREAILMGSAALGQTNGRYTDIFPVLLQISVGKWH